MFLVTGTGKSGTSACARVLHENGYCVGHYLKEDFFEDLEFITLVDGFVKGNTPFRFFIRDFCRIVKERENQFGDNWGLKYAIAPILGLLIQHVSNPKVVWCYRDPQQTIDSMNRSWNWVSGSAEDYTNATTRQMLTFFGTSSVTKIKIDFTNRLTDQEIAAALGISLQRKTLTTQKVAPTDYDSAGAFA